MQIFCCLREAQSFSNSDEVPQVPQFHDPPFDIKERLRLVVFEYESATPLTHVNPFTGPVWFEQYVKQRTHLSPGVVGRCSGLGKSTSPYCRKPTGQQRSY